MVQDLPNPFGHFFEGKLGGSASTELIASNDGI